VQNDKIMHVKIDRFFIKEMLDNELLEISHVATREQVVDCITKRFSSLDLARLCEMDLMNIFRPS
jgi:hypothetical protein